MPSLHRPAGRCPAATFDATARTRSVPWLLATGLLLAVFALAWPNAARAATPGGITTWSCWYGGQQQVACIVESAGTPATTASLDPRLPPQVRSMRLAPGTWRHKTVFIPLWDEPFDHAFVAQLAQSVLCGAHALCEARYRAEAPLDAPAFAALLADVNDPLLAD